MVALRLNGKEEKGVEKFWVGLPHFLPGGGAEFGTTPAEKYYFVLDGESTVKTGRKRLPSVPGTQSALLPMKAGQ